MAPAYKLHYFGLPGLAEPIRFLFAYGGLEYEDARFTREEWPAIQPNMPFGKVPVLEHNGKKIGQSNAIARYIAKKVKLAGNDDWEDLEIDAIVDTLGDFRMKIFANILLNKDLQDKEVQETMKFYLTRIDATIKDNNGFLALKRLTWADFLLVAGMDTLIAKLNSDIFASYPNIVGLRNKVLAIPQIKKWIESRPAPTVQ